MKWKNLIIFPNYLTSCKSSYCSWWNIIRKSQHRGSTQRNYVNFLWRCTTILLLRTDSSGNFINHLSLCWQLRLKILTIWNLSTSGEKSTVRSSKRKNRRILCTISQILIQQLHASYKNNRFVVSSHWWKSGIHGQSFGRFGGAIEKNAVSNCYQSCSRRNGHP